MSSKFNRAYILKIETGENEYTEIRPPMTLEFSIVRNNLAAANTANFVIYNLGPVLRDKIYKDIFDYSRFPAIQLYAGYAENPTDNLTLCFNGSIKRAFSHRTGPDFKTEIEAFDGQIAMGLGAVNITLPAGTSTEKVIEKLAGGANKLTGLVVGKVFKDQATRSASFIGSPQDAINEATGDSFYIDNGTGYALGNDDVIESDISFIDSDSGLIGTPKKSQTMVEIEMVFEPRFKPSQLIELRSTTEPKHNGFYKVTGFTHKGVISDAVGGDCKTSLTMRAIKNPNVEIDKATGNYRITYDE